MLTELRERIDLNTENFNKEIENIKMNQWKMSNSVTEIKNTLQGMNSRLSDMEECVSDLEHRIMEITLSEQQKENQILKNESNLRDLWNNLSKHSHYKGSRRRRKRERIQKCIWRNYGWKLPKPEEGSRYPDTGSTKGPQKDEPKQTHTNTYHN